MSLRTWKKEFYRKSSRGNALKHALLKWVGLRKPNTDKHNIDQYKALRNTPCALCVYYTCDYMRFAGNKKSQCPLSHNKDGDCITAYSKFKQTYNPEPMIKRIKRAIARKSR